MENASFDPQCMPAASAQIRISTTQEKIKDRCFPEGKHIQT